MKCPYCTSEIDNAALVCPHCTRDLTLFRPLLERINALESSLTARIDELALRIPDHAVDISPAPSETPALEEAGSEATREWIFAMLTPLLLLLAAHLVITQLWDARDWILYATSIAIPFLPGFRLLRLRQRPILFAALGGLLMAIVAVFGMSALTGIFDKTDWLPGDARGWRELVNYALSIGLSFLAGGILGQLLRERAKQREAARIRAIQRLSDKSFYPDSIHEVIKRLDTIGKAILALTTTVASFYSGLGRFLG